jgi:hypothetical protein
MAEYEGICNAGLSCQVHHSSQLLLVADCCRSIRVRYQTLVSHLRYPPRHSRKQDPHPLKFLAELSIPRHQIGLNVFLRICEGFEQGLQLLVPFQSLLLLASLFG